jgi:hypothetical protein
MPEMRKQGHQWRFTQSVANIHPAEWGGEAGLL